MGVASPCCSQSSYHTAETGILAITSTLFFVSTVVVSVAMVATTALRSAAAPSTGRAQIVFCRRVAMSDIGL